jgi:hypothetical protein
VCHLQSGIIFLWNIFKLPDLSEGTVANKRRTAETWKMKKEKKRARIITKQHNEGETKIIMEYIKITE